MNRPPVLITLTAPSAAGKSYLLNYIRDVAKLPCLISTTTRAKRANEVEGVDYFFISKEESEAIEARGEFAELAIFGGNRYGVTNTEFQTKLNSPAGVAFLIVEPEGINHYVEPALRVGAKHLKFFINVDLDTRLQRLQDRVFNDILELVPLMGENYSVNVNEASTQKLRNVIKSFSTRLNSVFVKEAQWEQMHQWDAVLDGTDEPQTNLAKILLILHEIK